MKDFLNKGLCTYAPALAAISEFRRQIRTRMQTVLDDFSAKFSGLGLPVDNLRLLDAKVDDQNSAANSFWIALERNYGGELYTGYQVYCNLEKPEDPQVQVGVWVYVGIRADRDRLFDALQKQRSLIKETHLEEARLVQDRNGKSRLSSKCDPSSFYCIEDVFRTLIDEWVDLLSGIGGIRPFLSAVASRTNTLPEEELKRL
jgi:hypothetical protein